jgi:hypothetical protein
MCGYFIHCYAAIFLHDGFNCCNGLRYHYSMHPRSRVRSRPKPSDFSDWKNPQHAFLRRGSKTICPMSELWGMYKNPALFVNSEIAGQIPLVPSSASRVRCVSDWYKAPLVVKEGSSRGEGTIGLTKPQCRINPEKRPLPFFLVR